MIGELLGLLDERPEFRWSERDVERMGYDLSTVRRNFKRQFGMTFLEMARQRRLRYGFDVLDRGGKVIEAQLEVGFDSPSQAIWIPTRIGDMIAVSSRSHLHLLEFVDRKALPRELSRLTGSGGVNLGIGRTAPTEQAAEELDTFFAGGGSNFRTPLAPPGTPFSQSVWRALRSIPAGETRSYSDIAREIGQPSATRAVARANGANQIALMIPCHRVIGADGSLTGYGGGLWRKQRLLEIEQHYKSETTKHTQ